MTFSLALALFLLVPLVEIWLLIRVGAVIGALPTIALVVFTALAGAALLRWQGLAVLDRLRKQLEQGELPALALVEGAMLLIAGALLLTPGFATDTLGFTLLVPAVRRYWAARLVAEDGWLWRRAQGGRGHVVIQGEYHRVDDQSRKDGEQ